MLLRDVWFKHGLWGGKGLWSNNKIKGGSITLNETTIPPIRRVVHVSPELLKGCHCVGLPATSAADDSFNHQSHAVQGLGEQVELFV